MTEWVKAAAAIDVAWPNVDLPDETVRLWYRLLADLDAAAVSRAVVALRAEPGREFPPGPGDIRAAVDGGTAEGGLAQVRAAIAEGTHTVKALSDPVARRVVRNLGGMKTLAGRTDRWAYDFRQAYQDAYRRQVVDGALGALDGAGGVAALLAGDADA